MAAPHKKANNNTSMTIFDGKKLSEEILSALKQRTGAWPKKPQLAVISVGDKGKNSPFINQKKKAAELLEFGFHHFQLDSPISESGLAQELGSIVANEGISAVVVQLPLPAGIGGGVLNIIPMIKDVDLLSDAAVGMFFDNRALVPPPTPTAVLKILEREKILLAGKKVALFGAGRLVGRFLIPMLSLRGAVVSIIEKGIPTHVAKEISLGADIVISAVGKPNLISRDMVRKEAIIIDAGFSTLDGKVAGDVDFEALRGYVSFVTPVPGGVGPVAVAVLMSNVAELYLLQQNGNGVTL